MKWKQNSQNEKNLTKRKYVSQNGNDVCDIKMNFTK